MRPLDVRALWARGHEVAYQGPPGGILRYGVDQDLRGDWAPLSADESKRIRYARTQQPRPLTDADMAQYKKDGAMSLTPDEVGQIVEAIEHLDWVRSVKDLLAQNAEAPESDVAPDQNFGQADPDPGFDEEEPRAYAADQCAAPGVQGPGSANDDRWKKPGDAQARYGADADPKAMLVDEQNARKQSGRMAPPQSHGAALADKMDAEGVEYQANLAPRGEAAGTYTDLRKSTPTKTQRRGSAEGQASLQTANFSRATQPSTQASINFSRRLHDDRDSAQKRENYRRERSPAQASAHETVVMADVRLRQSRKPIADAAMAMCLREGIPYEHALVKLGADVPPSLIKGC